VVHQLHRGATMHTKLLRLLAVTFMTWLLPATSALAACVQDTTWSPSVTSWHCSVQSEADLREASNLSGSATAVTAILQANLNLSAPLQVPGYLEIQATRYSLTAQFTGGGVIIFYGTDDSGSGSLTVAGASQTRIRSTGAGRLHLGANVANDI